MRVRIMMIAVALVLLPAMALFSSGQQEEEPERAAKHGGTVVAINNGVPRHFNGAVQSGMHTATASTQIFASPLRMDKDWNLQPYLAESWEISDDGLSVTLNLRDDARFHDGEPVTSEDVAFTIMVVKENHPFKTMMAPVERVDTPDPQTAVIRLAHPHPAILLALTPPLCPVLPKHIYGDGQELKTHPRNLDNPVGAGPFKFVEYKQGEYLDLERNDDFFLEGRPYLDRYIIKYVKDANNRVMMMQRGEAQYHFVEANAQNLNRTKDMDNLEITREGFSAIGSIYWITFNLRRKPLDDVRVRRAIAHAVDRDFIVDELFQGYAVPCLGPIAPDSPFSNPDVAAYKLDVDKANGLLDKAGYPRGDDGVRFSLHIDWAGGVVGRIISEYIASAVKKIGIDLRLRVAPDFPTFSKRVADWNFDIIFDNLYNWGDPVIGVHRAYQCDNIKHQIWTNVGGYCNPEADELMEKAGREINAEKREELYHEFTEVIVNDLPVHSLIVAPFHSVYSTKLKNVVTSIWGPMAPKDLLYLEE